MRTFTLTITTTVKHRFEIELESETMATAIQDAFPIVEQMRANLRRMAMENRGAPPMSAPHVIPSCSYHAEITKVESPDY